MDGPSILARTSWVCESHGILIKKLDILSTAHGYNNYPLQTLLLIQLHYWKRLPKADCRSLVCERSEFKARTSCHIVYDRRKKHYRHQKPF